MDVVDCAEPARVTPHVKMVSAKPAPALRDNLVTMEINAPTMMPVLKERAQANHMNATMARTVRMMLAMARASVFSKSQQADV